MRLRRDKLKPLYHRKDDPVRRDSHMRRLPKKISYRWVFLNKNLGGACEVAQRAVKSSAIDGARCLDELGKKSCQKIRSEREVRAI